MPVLAHGLFRFLRKALIGGPPLVLRYARCPGVGSGRHAPFSMPLGFRPVPGVSKSRWTMTNARRVFFCLLILVTYFFRELLRAGCCWPALLPIVLPILTTRNGWGDLPSMTYNLPCAQRGRECPSILLVNLCDPLNTENAKGAKNAQKQRGTVSTIFF